jgi:hypothetical protein
MIRPATSWRRIMGNQETLWESYLVGPGANSDPTQWRTELNLPLRPPSPHKG